ncbi:MAG: tail fiber domain-containing protein [Candidatus Acidiferrales bacterium]
MKKILSVLIVALFSCNIAHAQFFNLFGPVNGVLKGNTSTPQTSAAVSSDIYGLWTGTNCGTSGDALLNNGNCAAVTGTTGANPSATIGLTAVNGSATTFLRSDGAPPLSQAIVPTWTGEHTFSGKININSELDLSGSAGTATNVLQSNGSGAAPTWVAAASGATGANPTGVVGLTAVNGSATTFLRSDGAPPLSQSIAPTWTGDHIFTPASGTAIVINAATGAQGEQINGAFAHFAIIVIGNPGTGVSEGVDIVAGTNSADFGLNVLNTSSQPMLQVHGNGAVSVPELASSSGAATGALCWTTSTGNVTVNTTTTCTTSSDAFKNHIATIGHLSGLTELMRFRPVSYFYNDTSMSDGEQVGLVAEEVQKIDPRLVAYELGSTTKLQGVRYPQLEAVIIQAVQQQAYLSLFWLLLLTAGFIYHQVKLRAMQRQLDLVSVKK